MIPQPRTAKQVKEDFLEKNPNLTEIIDKNPSIGDFYNIDDDDEIWIMQCPKGTDLSVLKDDKLKLPGRSNQNSFETVAVEYVQPVQHAFGHKNRKGHNNIKIVSIRGSIVLRSRLNAVTPLEETVSLGKTMRVPNPDGIKERHPLHGVNYKTVLEINKDIAERLKKADSINTHKISKKSKRKSGTTKEPGTIAVDSDGDVELVMQKKAKKKKKKRKNSEDEKPAELSSHKKKSKISTSNGLDDDIAADLQWINNL